MNSELNTQAPTEKQIKSVENAIEHFKKGKWSLLLMTKEEKMKVI